MPSSAHVLSPSPAIDWNARPAFLVMSRDGALIFDLDGNRFRKLDPVGAEMWKLLSSGMAEDEAAACIAHRYQVDLQLVQGDLRRLLATAGEFGLSPKQVCITHQPKLWNEDQAQPSYPWYGQDASAPRPKADSWTVVKALLGLFWFDRVLSRYSLKGLCRRVSEWPVQVQRKQGDPECVGRVCAAVEKACVWYGKPAVCLQRSAVTTCLLRNHGIAARMIIASKVMPLEPHAWVEVDACPVNDFPKVRNLYLRFVSL